MAPQSEGQGDSPSPVPGSFNDELDKMTDIAFLKTRLYQAQQWRVRRDGLHPSLQIFEPLLIKRMETLGVPMFCHCAVRTPDEQAKVFAEGFSKLRYGPHNAGLAVDIIHGVRAWNLSRKQWALIGHIGKELAQSRGLKLVWGGDWKDPWDPAHWEVKGWPGLDQGFPFPALPKG